MPTRLERWPMTCVAAKSRWSFLEAKHHLARCRRQSATFVGLGLWTLRPVDLSGQNRLVASHSDVAADPGLLSQLVEGAPDAFLVIDDEGRITLANRQTEVLFGYDRTDLIGRSVDILLPERLRRQHVVARERYAHRPALRPMGDGRLLLGRRRDGHEFPVEVGLAPLAGTDGTVLFTAVIRDVTARTQMQDELLRLALHDPLTGLPNRSLGMDRLRGALARSRRRGSAIAVLFVDIDQLKVVNDGLGHDAGDALIKTIGERMAAEVRPSDTVSRIGGDEFLVVIEDVSGPDEVVRLSDRLLTAVRMPITVAGHELRPTLSVGAALSSPFSTSDSIVQEADDAMYRAKHNGRDQIEVFRAEWRADMRREIDLRTALGRAVDHGEVGMTFQPVVELNTGNVWGAEALLHWTLPDGQEVPGAGVARLAERSQLIVALDRLALRTACRSLADLAPTGAMRVGVNVSGRQLASEGVSAFISGLIDEFGVPAGALWIELTRADQRASSPDALKVLAHLRSLGVLVAIDDFGAGFSSLSRLRHLPVDILKIDRSFVRDIDTDRRGRQIVAATVQLAHALGLVAVAEGVEDDGQLAALAELGCDFGQGRYWSPILTLDRQ